jgi:hypothetical protein
MLAAVKQAEAECWGPNLWLGPAAARGASDSSTRTMVSTSVRSSTAGRVPPVQAWRYETLISTAQGGWMGSLLAPIESEPVERIQRLADGVDEVLRVGNDVYGVIFVEIFIR